MADTSLFGRLKRLFSSDVIIRNVGGDQLKVIDTDRIQSLGALQTNALVDRFTKIYTTSGAGVYNLNNVLNYQTMRVQLYTDYEAMDTDAIVASALDIIADECTLKNDFGEVIHIKSSDENIQKILRNLFYDVLNIEFTLWSWTRNMCKYGDFYLKLNDLDRVIQQYLGWPDAGRHSGRMSQEDFDAMEELIKHWFNKGFHLLITICFINLICILH